jgi:hypothetical protein
MRSKYSDSASGVTRAGVKRSINGRSRECVRELNRGEEITHDNFINMNPSEVEQFDREFQAAGRYTPVERDSIGGERRYLNDGRRMNQSLMTEPETGVLREAYERVRPERGPGIPRPLQRD